MALKDTLVCHPNDPLPPWHDSLELLWRCEDIILSRPYDATLTE